MATDQTQRRTLVLCFDGTANKYDAKNTNIVRLFALLKKDNLEQLTFYQPGIGTWFQPGVVSPVFEWAAKLLDEAFAWYLDAHVMEGYTFLMNNHREGDRIFIFGFSRGAYTARALAGFIHKVGLLPRNNGSQVSFAYSMYTGTDAESLKLCAGFKQTYCRTVTIDFMGVWDTVASVGLLWSRSLPFTNSNSTIKIFRHALSLDEHRTKYRPNYYHRTPPETDPEDSAKFDSGGSLAMSASEQSQTTEDSDSDAMETEDPDVLEVWFAGCHTDVGGGAVSNGVKQSLSNISLRWMVREAVASGCGVIFDASALLREKINVEPETTTADLEMDSIDALKPLHDQLRIKFAWWLLEFVPFSYSMQDANHVWHTSSMPNLGRGRQIVDPHPKMHITVKKRMETLKYKPKARWEPNSEVFIN